MYIEITDVAWVMDESCDNLMIKKLKTITIFALENNWLLIKQKWQGQAEKKNEHFFKNSIQFHSPVKLLKFLSSILRKYS